jgi:hypothetical protein
MNDVMKLWIRMFLRLGIVLLAVGFIPLALTSTILTTWDQLIPIMLSFTIAPIGVLCVLVALILFLVALVRRRPGSS